MDYVTIIMQTAKYLKISGVLLVAICSHESGLKNIVVPHDGGTDTYGVCQIKFGTAQMFGYKGYPQGLMDPRVNILYAAKYLQYQQDRYGDNWCKQVSAYNAGKYTESKKMPGKPRNLVYVRHVQKRLKKSLRYKLACDNNR